MDMVSIMTQPKDVTALATGTASAGAIPSAPGMSVTPLLFASMLQEMLPEVQGAAEPVLIEMNPPATVKNLLPRKGVAKINQEDGAGDAVELSPAGLAQLLAMTGQFMAAQPRLQSDVPVESCAPGSAVINCSVAPDSEGVDEVSALIPATSTPGEAGAEGLPSTHQSVIPAGCGSPAPAQMPEVTVKTRSANSRQEPGGSKLDVGDGLPPLQQSRQAVSRNATPKVMTGTVEKPAVPPSGSEAIPTGVSSSAPPSVPSVVTSSAPPAVPVNGDSLDLNVAVVATLPGGAPESGRIDNLLPQPKGRTAGLQPVRADIPGSGQPAEAVRTNLTNSPTERRAGQVQARQEVSAGKQAQILPAAVSPLPIQNLADTGQPDGTQKPGLTRASEASSAVEAGAFIGMSQAVQGWKDAQTLQEAGTVADNPAGPTVEVVFAGPSDQGSASGEKDRRESGSKENEKDTGPGFGVATVRTNDLQGTNRSAFQAKVEETGNALHESILTQVKASVVSHDGKGNGTMTIRLNPEELGELQVNVRVENLQVKVEIITENRTVRDALMGNLDTLKETFQKQNLNMERFDVSSGSGNCFGHGFKEERDGQRRISTTPFGHEAAPLEFAMENGEDDWDISENSLVNLRL